MHLRTLGLAALVLLLALDRGFGAGTHVGDFALLDTQGTFHQLSRYADQRAVVLFVHGNGCPVVQAALPALDKLRENFADRPIQFLLLNSIVHDDLLSIRAEAKKQDLKFPILKDEAQLVAESLGVVYTSEVFVIDPKTQTLVYRGPIDNRKEPDGPADTATRDYLNEALAAMLADRAVSLDAPEVNGCLVSFPARTRDSARTISYTKEIVPILETRCVECHVDGGIGPFAMNSGPGLKGWGPMMIETMLTRRMPPGQVDREVGRWRDVHEMPAAEQTTLAHWLASGAPLDGDSDPLAKAQPRDSKAWNLGEPDLVIALPEQEVPATGTVRIKSIAIPLDVPVEKWVRAVEFKVENKAVMHHITATVVPAGTKAARPARGEADEEPAEGQGPSSGFSYAPGMPLTVYPDDVGFRLMQNAECRLSVHYFTNGKAVTENTKVGLYFHKQQPRHEVRRISAGSGRAVMSDEGRLHASSGQRIVEADSYLYNLRPYMTFYGNSMVYTAHFPDGTVQKLLNVPNYNFYWQMNYTPAEPVFLPKGTKLVVDGVFGEQYSSGLNIGRENFTGYIQLYNAN